MSAVIDISETIMLQIQSLDDDWTITAFNNDTTPFNVVFFVLRSVVPLSDEKAFDYTLAIHNMGECTVYCGSLKHCELIEAALKEINVVSEIKKSE